MIMLRPGTREDIEAVLVFWRNATAEPSTTDDADGLGALLVRSRGALVLALDNDVIVGSIIAGWDGWRGTLYRLAVLPSRVRSIVLDLGELRADRSGPVREVAHLARRLIRVAMSFGWACRWADTCRREPEALDVHVMQFRPALVRFPRLAGEGELEAIEAHVPAGGIARGLAELFQRVGESENGALFSGFELDAQEVLAPEELQHAGRVVREHGAVEPRTLAVAELEPQRGTIGALADDLGREPRGQMLGLGERAPNLLRRMRQRARKADAPLVAELFECSFSFRGSSLSRGHGFEVAFEIVEACAP